MNRAPTWVRPAANGYRLGQHAVLPLPRDSGCDVIASLPEGGEGEVGGEPDPKGRAEHGVRPLPSCGCDLNRVFLPNLVTR